jgi:hypothetical protein
MGYHYIPQYYLRGFAVEPELEYIYCLEKGTGRYFKPNLINVGQENYLYSGAIKTRLTDEIEHPCIPVFEKIRSRKPISSDEKRQLTDHILLLMVRGPSRRDEVHQWTTENSDLHLEKLEEQLKRDKENQPEKELKIDSTLAVVQRIRNEKLIDPKDIWHRILSPDFYPKSRSALQAMKWQFYVHPERVFLTSDNPVFYFEHLGIGNKLSELSLPISSNIALLASWDQFAKASFLTPTDRQIMEINNRTVLSATKFVYSHEVSDYKIRLVKKKNIQVNKLINRVTFPQHFQIGPI